MEILTVTVPVKGLIELLEVASKIDATRRVRFDLVFTPGDIYVEYYYHDTILSTTVSEYGRIFLEKRIFPETKIDRTVRVDMRFPMVMGLNLLKKLHSSGTEKVKIQIPCQKIEISYTDPRELFIPAS
jgi:hypothetical protein